MFFNETGIPKTGYFISLNEKIREKENERVKERGGRNKIAKLCAKLGDQCSTKLNLVVLYYTINALQTYVRLKHQNRGVTPQFTVEGFFLVLF